jgi:protoporphyrinogen oxidase
MFFTGNAFFGIGLNDCVGSAGKVAEQVFEHIRQSG